MNIRDFGTSNLILALPIIQISCVAIFLASYCLGFGANLYVFLTISDIFNVSIGSIVPAYVLFFAIPGLQGWLSHRIPTAADKVFSILDQDLRAKAMIKLRRSRRILLYIISATFVVSFFVAFSFALFDGTASFPALLACGVSFSMLLAFALSEEYDLSRSSLTIFIVVSIAIANLSISGIRRGNEDRLSPYKLYKMTNPSCGKYVILRKVADLYLVVAPFDTRILVDEKCEARFIIPPPRKRLIRSVLFGDRDHKSTYDHR